MGVHCCGHDHHHGDAGEHGSPGNSPAYRRILWVALILNAAMFLVEIAAGFTAGSASLQADALDFLGDAANYGVSLFVLGMSLRSRALASLVKGASMGLFGIWVLIDAAMMLAGSRLPDAQVMGGIGVLALLVNVAVAILLYRWREGDSNMRSVWLCTRNDAIGNVAVMLAALGVFGTGTGWPDLVVAAVMASLALWASAHVIRQALSERARPTGRPMFEHNHQH